MRTDQFNHAPAQIFMNTGSQLPGRPSMGAWLSYGIGSENANLPAFIVLISGQQNPEGGKSCWRADLADHPPGGRVSFEAETRFLLLSNPKGISPDVRRESLTTLRKLNEAHLDSVGDPEVATRIASYQMAYRMQSSVPELMNIEQSTPFCSPDDGTEPGTVSFAKYRRLARRLLERGVRPSTHHRGWDHHGTTSRDDRDPGRRDAPGDRSAGAASIKD